MRSRAGRADSEPPTRNTSEKRGRGRSLGCTMALGLFAAVGGCMDEAATPPAAGGVEVRRDAVTAPYDWLQLGGDPSHSSNNTKEGTIGTSNVAQLTLRFQAM